MRIHKFTNYFMQYFKEGQRLEYRGPNWTIWGHIKLSAKMAYYAIYGY